jgi:hypothetical protein
MEFEFDRQEIIGRVTANRDRHVKEYALALRGYQADMEQEARALAEKASKIARQAKRGTLTPEGEHRHGFHFEAEAPKLFERDYNRVLAMLEMTPTDSVSLTEQDFARFVLDDWEWKKDFDHMFRTYGFKYDFETPA